MKRKRSCNDSRSRDQIAESRRAAEAISVTIRWLADVCTKCFEKFEAVDHFCQACLAPRSREFGIDEADNVLQAMALVSFKDFEETKKRYVASGGAAAAARAAEERREDSAVTALVEKYRTALATGPLLDTEARAMVVGCHAKQRASRRAFDAIGAIRTRAGWIAP